MLKRLRLLLLAVVLAVSSSMLYVLPAEAVLSSCNADVTPHTVTRDTNARFNFTVTSPDTIARVEIFAPSTDFTITNAGGSAWNVNSLGADHVILIRGGSGDTFFIDVTTGSSDTGLEAWSVQADDDPGGADLVVCTGNLDATISGAGPDSGAPNISNLSLSNLTATSVTVTWTTDEPATSRVDYGPDDSYGQVKTSSTLKTTHSVVLTGLNPNSGYHYMVTSADAANNTASSDDNTFLTPLSGQGSSGSPATSIPIKSIPTESVPPTIQLSTSLTTPFKQTPMVSGTAGDNEAIAGIEYSTDGGQNWLPADSVTGLGGKNVTFTFTPSNLDDGNYTVIARAIDTSGNIGVTQAATLVIDRLPPLVGGNVISLGPQILEPRQNGTAKALAGIDQKITLSAVGGPTSIVLAATTTSGQGKPKQFTLTKSNDTGLWSGLLAFKEPGTYNLTANSVDGAGNKTSRLVSTVQVEKLAKITDAAGTKGLAATVTAYFFEPESEEWVIWDSAPYGQTNPQKTDKQGRFTLLLPPGTYYLRATSGGYRSVSTRIFKIDRPTPISADLRLQKRNLLNFGSDIVSLDIKNTSAQPGTAQDPLIGQTLPSLSLQATNGQSVNTVSWLGKPTVLTLTSIWSPMTAQQVPTLTKMQKNSDINVVPVAVQEGLAKAKVYASLSGYNLTWVADPTSTLSSHLRVQNLPTHYFIDRKGVIQKIMTGTLTEKQLTDVLTGL